MPESDVDPNVYRRRLRNTLRRMRDALGITQTAAAKEMSWSVSKLIRIETGQVTISVNDLRALLTLYNVTDQQTVEQLIDMAKQSRVHSWTHAYRGVASDVFLAFLGHEAAATRSYSFQPVLVPGLLQTDDYAREALRVTRGSKDPDRINGLVALRIARQERIVSRADEIKLSYLLDESVVRRIVGGPQTMRQQVEALRDAYDQGHLSIRILPFRCGLYRSMRVPFVVLEFSDPAEDPVLYLEYPQGESLIREDGPFEPASATDTSASPPTTPPTYLQIFAELQQQTSDEETREILESALRELGS
jgi:transcriptional regulator with XRE-family HTH domain